LFHKETANLRLGNVREGAGAIAVPRCLPQPATARKSTGAPAEPQHPPSNRGEFSQLLQNRQAAFNGKGLMLFCCVLVLRSYSVNYPYGWAGWAVRGWQSAAALSWAEKPSRLVK